MRKVFNLLTLASLLGLMLAMAPGCADDLGTPCDVGKISKKQTIQLNPQAMMCKSRLCIHVQGDSTAQPLCTRICEEDKDCEIYDVDKAITSDDPNEPGICDTGFVCAYATSVGGLACCKMCVCKRFFDSSNDKLTQDACRKKVDSEGAPSCPSL